MNILRREEFDDLNFDGRLNYINKAILKFGVRAKAYKEIGIAKSTIESMMKANDYEFNKELNQFVHSTSIAKDNVYSGCLADAEQHCGCIEDDMQHSDCVALVEQSSNSIVNVEQQEAIMKKLFNNWSVLENIINDYKSNIDIIDIDTTVKLKDIPEGNSKSVNLRLNEHIWKDFNKYISKKHKGISQKNMVEIALLQFVKDRK